MSDHPERGSAVVEFAGVGVLVTFAALGVMQVGLIAHVQSVVTDSAVAGAAYAALADSSLAAGVTRTRDLIDAGIASELVTDVTAATTVVSGLPVVAVTVGYRVPAIGPWVPLVSSTVTGRAFVEVS